jgi:hypothetical protein
MQSNWLPLAYLDPGIGSLWIQMLIALVVSSGFFLRTYVGGAFGWMLRKVRGTPALQQTAEPVASTSTPAERPSA